ncbi:uncharacterized protein LOC144641151 [Oculina patagonica]
MKVSLLLLTALSVALLSYVLHQSQASEQSQLLENEIQELKDEIEKRGRPPCGLTWRCKRRRSRRGKHFWGKRNGMSHRSGTFDSFGSDDMDDMLNDNVSEE